MKRIHVFITAILLFSVIELSPGRVTGGDSTLSGNSLLGFSASSTREQRTLESTFDSYLNRDDLREWMKQLTSRPHHLGSPYGKKNAEYIARLFRSWGFETNIEEFYVLFPTPKTRLLEMTAPELYTAKLSEPPLNEDSTSQQTSEQLPTYNAYSIDGDVTGELVYVNYGIPKDYEQLDQRGIDVKGKIVIARYGGSWRGIKPKVAAEHGAIGCIIYSDPRDDGYAEGDVYPKGAYRNEWGVQRGSVADAPLHSGDPSTPFVGATKGVKRLSVKESETITKIPVLPISYGDALPLLRALGGPVAPEEWRGALPITYHLGPGPVKIHLKAQFNWDIVPLYNVIATLKGAEFSDEWIIRGNHHDAWVNGAEDPISGLVALMGEAKAVGKLSATGWKPKRTIIYAAWDGEEQGLLGSTEWVESHIDDLKKHAAVYINTDGNGRGFFSMGGSHILERFINEVARDVTDPQTHVSAHERARAAAIVNASAEDRKEAQDRNDLRIYALGSGSDYTPFLQHVGIAALNLGYGGEDGGGSYHSIYDSYSHYTRFGDPGFSYGIALAQTAGRATLRLANADVLPFEFMNFSETVGKYIKEVSKLADDMRAATNEQNQMIKDNSLKLASDPTMTYVVPQPKESVPFLNFAPLQNALAVLQERANVFNKVARSVDIQILPHSVKKDLDQLFIQAEQSLTRKEGLPRRPWYVHQIYAPGAYTGYGVKTLPAIREAIELRNWKEADEQITVVADILLQFADGIHRATSLLKSVEKN